MERTLLIIKYTEQASGDLYFRAGACLKQPSAKTRRRPEREPARAFRPIDPGGYGNGKRSIFAGSLRRDQPSLPVAHFVSDLDFMPVPLSQFGEEEFEGRPTASVHSAGAAKEAKTPGVPPAQAAEIRQLSRKNRHQTPSLRSHRIKKAAGV